MFGAFSYIAYTFTEVSGFSGTDVAWLLVSTAAAWWSATSPAGRAPTATATAR